MLAPPSVLLIEDDPVHVEYLHRVLTRLGDVAEVVVATSLANGLALLHDRPFDVVLTDQALPDADGLESVVRIQTACPEATLMVLTGNDDDELALESIRRGAQDYLTKQDLDAQRLFRAIRFARERKIAERRLAHLAFTDPLTGLPNRRTFVERLEAALGRADRSGLGLAVVFVDLDGLKQVNDELGHGHGDRFIQRAAERLSRGVREVDTVARLAGDEFSILMEGLGDPGSLERLLERVRRVLEARVDEPGIDVAIPASLGVASFPDDGRTSAALLRVADERTYAEKRRRRGQRPRNRPASLEGTGV